MHSLQPQQNAQLRPRGHDENILEEAYRGRYARQRLLNFWPESSCGYHAIKRFVCIIQVVRIYVRGELIKTHDRKPRGGRSTDYTDYPDGKAPYAMRWPNFYSKQARELGPSIGDFTDQLLSGEFPWSRLRSAQKLLGLADRYGAERLNAACQRALRFEL